MDTIIEVFIDDNDIIRFNPYGVIHYPHLTIKEYLDEYQYDIKPGYELHVESCKRWTL